VNDGWGGFLLAPSGAMRPGWVGAGDTWYWLADNGRMGTGWLQQAGSWYWLEPSDGRMAVGVVSVDGRTSQFAPSGRRLGYA